MCMYAVMAAVECLLLRGVQCAVITEVCVASCVEEKVQVKGHSWWVHLCLIMAVFVRGSRLLFTSVNVLRNY